MVRTHNHSCALVAHSPTVPSHCWDSTSTSSLFSVPLLKAHWIKQSTALAANHDCLCTVLLLKQSSESIAHRIKQSAVLAANHDWLCTVLQLKQSSQTIAHHSANHESILKFDRIKVSSLFNHHCLCNRICVPLPVSATARYAYLLALATQSVVRSNQSSTTTTSSSTQYQYFTQYCSVLSQKTCYEEVSTCSTRKQQQQKYQWVTTSS